MISYIMTESNKGNPVIKITIDMGTHTEELFGWAGYYRAKELDNMINKEDLKELKLNLLMTNKLWKAKNKESEKKVCKSFDKA